MTEEDREEISGYAAVTILFGMILLLALFVLFAWAPVSHYLGKWNDYWWEGDGDYTVSSSITEQINLSMSRYYEAQNDCGARGVAAGYRSELSFASSTGDNYETYDCYVLLSKNI